ncbi:hypothetical protein EDC96DRAFT_493855 [Choanephora cucurbitarum]|nr:hypothetical protein EDC96DRAFT_493855 [Choanephora cucurbitarum]
MRLPSIANLLVDLPPTHYGIPPIPPLRLPLCFDRQTQSPPLYSSKRQRSISSLPSTQIIFDDAGQPKLKRKRGRPPTVQLDGSWTFLAPTVWNIPISRTEHRDRQTTDDSDTIMTSAMAAFTSSKMDMVLPMPHKKRGRKPKTHLVGNSCFVWKDLTLTRSKKTV